MTAIIPAILAKSREDLEHKLAALVGMVDLVQIDIIDGKFASPASWPYTESDAASSLSGDDLLPYLGQLHYEMDLMVSEPDATVGSWITAGAERILLHAESSRFIANTIATLQTKYGHAKDFAPGLLSIGIAINVQSDLALIEPFINDVDYVQFMGIARIGVQGQPFDSSVLRRISKFRSKHADIPIQVDGGVTLENADQLISAGVDRLVVGSALWKAQDMMDVYHKLTDIAHAHGIYS